MMLDFCGLSLGVMAIGFCFGFAGLLVGIMCCWIALVCGLIYWWCCCFSLLVVIACFGCFGLISVYGVVARCVF